MKKNIKKRILKIIVTVFAAGVLFTGYWLWNHYAVWSYLGISVMAHASTNTPSPTSTPKLTPKPTATTSLSQKTDIINVTPTPTPHPGIRDNKFTNGEIVCDDMSYRDSDISIEIEKIVQNDIIYFVADVYVRTVDFLTTAFANDEFENNGFFTSKIVNDNCAIFGVNGDFYTKQNWGIIIRNGKLYRDIPRLDILAIYKDGTMETFHTDEITSDDLINNNAVQSFSFGPLLIEDGKAITDFSGTANRLRHPRCGIGYIEPYHYIFIVVDGRKMNYSIGMTLEEFAGAFKSRNCTHAYNLDGGGSATMVFMGKLVNMPQGSSYKERPISDAVLIGEGKLTLPQE